VTNPWLVLLSVALGQFMVVVDVTILNIALPAIATELGASMAGLEWAMIAYSLTMIGLVPAFGRMSDVMGRKRLYIAGLLVFSAASAMAALANGIELLIAARVVQAVGGALITSNTLAILTDTFPEGRRGVAMGVQAILISGGAAVGPTLGGFLVTHFGWEAVFLVNLPVGAVGTLLALVTLPALVKRRAREPFDGIGAALLMIALSALLLGVTKAIEWGWTSRATLISLTVGVVSFVLFLGRERRFSHPLIQPSLMRNRPFIAGQLAGTLAMLSLLGMSFLMPFYWQGLRGMSAQYAGVLMLPLPLGIMVLSPVSGRLSDAYGARGIATAGMLLVTAGLWLMSRVDADTAIASVLCRYTLVGIGLGMFLAPNNNAIMSAAPGAHRGVASGLIALFRFTGQSLGIAFGGTVFLHAASAAAGNRVLEASELAHLSSDPQLFEALRGAFESGFRTLCLTSLPLSLLGALLSFARGKPLQGDRSTTTGK
jgi:EmrB/QacA subfamily drug resistance transporter